MSFDEDQVHVPHQFLDYYEEQELWTPYAFPGVARYPGAPGRAISTFSSFCALSVIMVCALPWHFADSAGKGHHPYLRGEDITESSRRVLEPTHGESRPVEARPSGDDRV